MKAELLRNTNVRFAAGAVLDVPDEEGARLIAFRLAAKVVEKKAEAKTPAKKKKA